MALEDYETGKNIINPYISLYSPEGVWVALNTENFSKAQNSIISIYDEKTFLEYLFDKKSRVYKVVATVGKQDHPFDYEEKLQWTRGVRRSGAEDAIALIPLGHILEDIA